MSSQTVEKRPIPSPFSTPDHDYAELKDFIDSRGARSVVEDINNIIAYAGAQAMVDSLSDSWEGKQKMDLFNAILNLRELARIIADMDWRYVTYLISNNEES